MKKEELDRLVALGENAFVEFKQRVPEPKRIAKEIVAFANSRGGSVLIGVEDDGGVCGVKDSAEEEFALFSSIEMHCTPVIEVESVRVPISRKREVIVVRVLPSNEKPHFVADGDQRTAYVRIADQSVEASKEAVRIMRSRPGDEVRFEFGDKELLLMRYLDQYGRITVSQFARLAGVKRKQASHTIVLMTRAGVLMLHYDEKEDFFTVVPKIDRGAA